MKDLHACIDFLQRLIQTQSLPGEEGDIASLVMTEMHELGYDKVYADEAGNVIGCIKGTGAAQPVMFNTHLDHVAVGDEAAWPYPPFGGEIHDERIWGRGAVDIKGPLAAQVYGVGRLKAKRTPPPGDVYVTAVVFEEVGGVGARHMATHLCPELIVIGEPCRNKLMRGHRGRLELQLHVKGRSVHASIPHKGVNPLEVIAGVVSGLNTLDMPHDVDLGSSSVAPTLIRTDQISSNVVPAEVWLTLDWRNVPAESEADVLAKLQTLIDNSLIPGATATLSIPSQNRECYTGFSMDIAACNYPFITRMEDPVLQSAYQVLSNSLDQPPAIDLWRFATDGGHFALAGATCVGFAPGDDALAHTIDEHIEIAEIAAALDGNEALALHWAKQFDALKD